MSWVEWANETFKTYAPTLDAADKLIGIAISAGLFWLAHRANAIAKSNLELAKQERETRKYRIDKDEREIFKSVYEKLARANGNIMTDGRATDETRALYWQARDQARLELPDDIQQYTQKLFDKMQELYSLTLQLRTSENRGLPIGPDRTAAAQRQAELISELYNEKPYQVFSPYMKVKVS